MRILHGCGGVDAPSDGGSMASGCTETDIIRLIRKRYKKNRILQQVLNREPCSLFLVIQPVNIV